MGRTVGQNPGVPGAGVSVQAERFLLPLQQAPGKAGGCDVREVSCSCVVFTWSPMVQLG